MRLEEVFDVQRRGTDVCEWGMERIYCRKSQFRN